MNLTRDEWMLISRALEDREDALVERGGTGRPLMGEEIENAKALRKRVDAHVLDLWTRPAIQQAAE